MSEYLVIHIFSLTDS